MTAGVEKRSGIWSRPFIILFAVNFVINFAQFMTLVLVPKLAQSLGATAIVVGVVTGIFAVTALAVRPAVGWATLTVRHSTLLAGTVAFIFAAFVIYAFSTDLTLLIVARLIHGAAMGFLAPVTLTMASGTLPASRMAQGIGVFSLGQAVSTAVGPSVGLWLVSVVGYRGTFLLGSVFMLVAAFFASRVRSLRPPATAFARFGWRSFIAVEAIVQAAVMFCLAGAFSTVNTFIVLYGESRGVDQIGLFFTAYAGFILISRPLAGRLADKRGLAVVIVPGMIMFAASFVLISQVRTLGGFLAAGALSALGYGVCQPAVQTLSLMSVEPARRGVASNTNYLGVDLGYLVMPIVAGSIVTTATDSGVALPDAYSIMFLSLTALIALGIVVFAIVRPRSVGPADPPPLPTPDF